MRFCNHHDQRYNSNSLKFRPDRGGNRPRDSPGCCIHSFAYCPTPPSEDRRPLDRVRDLFDGAKDTRNALMWLSAGEIATVALIGIAAVLLVFFLLKRGIS